MDKIEQMENVLKEYEKMEETLKNLEGDKKRAENKREKAEERYNEAEAEFGKNTVNEYEEAVLEEYKKLMQQSEQEFGSVEESIKTGQRDLENMSTDNNIKIVTQGVKEIEKQIEIKELKLKRSQLDLIQHAVVAADSIRLQSLHGTALIQNKYKLCQIFSHFSFPPCVL